MDTIPLLVDFAAPSSVFREEDRISALPIIGNGPPGAVRPFETNAPPSPGLQKPVASSPITGTMVNAS